MADVTFSSLLKGCTELVSSINSRPPLEMKHGDKEQGKVPSGVVMEMGVDQDMLEDMNWSSGSEDDVPGEIDGIVAALISEADQVDETATELFQSLMTLKELYSQVERGRQELMAEEVAKSEAIKEYYALCFNLFESTQGLSSNENLMQLYFLVSSNIEGWLDVSIPVCREVACHGLLMQNINDLLYFTSSPAACSSEVLLSAIEAQVGIIYNCSRNFSLPKFYYSRFPWAEIIASLLSTFSGEVGIRLTCKLLATTMAECFQKDEQLKLLDVASSDLAGLKVALINASSSPDKSAVVFGYNYSALELLTALQSFLCRPSNCATLMDSSLLVAVKNLLHGGEQVEKIAAVKLLWHLLEHKELKESVLKEHKGVIEVLRAEVVKGHDVEGLSLWCKGVLAAMEVPHSDTDNEADQLLTTVKCNYLAKKYSQCVELCDKIPAVAELQLYKGKALYHIYQARQRILRGLSNKQELLRGHQACYAIAREVLIVLGRAKDDGYIDDDMMSQRMLDFAMMDYMLETNKLKEIKRCFLCLHRQQHQASTPATAGPKSMLPDANIKRSHLIPHGVIRRLTKADDKKQQDTKKASKNVVFGVSGTKMDSERTPATATVHMLCGSCEQLINVNGEHLFLKFFEMLIDPSCSNTEQQIGYGKELYYCCLSLIFRTLCPSQDEYINADEVYKLLVQCRTYLLAADATAAIKEEDLPQVFLFVHAGSEDKTDEHYTLFLEQSSVSYTSKIGLSCKKEELDTFESVYANFFIVKMGVAIVLVRFKPAMDYFMNNQYCIHHSGGVYSVPALADRISVIPHGLHTVLHILYEAYIADLKKFNKLPSDELSTIAAAASSTSTT